ncbi:MAG: hypothetical protein ACI82A_002735 [Candidatus Azotimanducaceae bacterium]|jgi:hypothetical protein
MASSDLGRPPLYWQPIEQYASEQMDYHNFSHGIFGACKVDLYGDEFHES